MAIEKKTYFTVEYSDLEQLIKEKLGIEYEILPYEEAGGDNSYLLQIVNGDPLLDYEEEYLKDLKKGKPVHFALNTLLAKLCRTGNICAGEYLINCSH
ncbi:hypothetical protein VPHD104_0143 [Vibrio phage D104]|nr:hypothetical protein SIPHO035v1_p0118 [Vibrio phage 234P7B]QZI88575.1 hypothetical protein SIPHO037v1_p0134 [Vibrio phage 70E35.2]QZI88759.1 hypothetical protein SIPHO039v1_p0130 [Vibrio phage 70E35.5a]